jgi:hypothetical protein
VLGSEVLRTNDLKCGFAIYDEVKILVYGFCRLSGFGKLALNGGGSIVACALGSTGYENSECDYEREQKRG